MKVPAKFFMGLLLLFLLLPYSHGLQFQNHNHQNSTVQVSSAGTSTAQSATHRKFLLGRAAASAHPDRYWSLSQCSETDIVVEQGPTDPLPSGIPTYTVKVMNACISGCDISGIHLHCGWFATARVINPTIFRRLGFNNCLVNDGKVIPNGQTVSFQYANTYPYHLSVASVVCPDS
ncbi:protein TAPETUM DETERMINANT 1-like [Malania oleifera]|uniref:protein TAPETUM DETERMINANT 1-like n=1 Tax=Malania oleifera TaxID=397392 RepID=UPI0025AEC01C|nr:protein TAPETUM DETERMINANT 1-like [Malania oleifera]